MRVASRFMRGVKRRRISPLGWVVAGVMIVAFLYIFFLIPFWVGGFVLLVAAIGVVEQRRTRRRLSRLAAGRPGESIGTFARAFDARSTDTWVIRAVYEQLQDWLKGDYPSFPLRPTDRLEEDLKLDPDDLDMELADEISERTGRPLAGAERNPYFGKIKTAADLVFFFCAQAKNAGDQRRAPENDRESR